MGIYIYTIYIVSYIYIYIHPPWILSNERYPTDQQTSSEDPLCSGVGGAAAPPHLGDGAIRGGQKGGPKGAVGNGEVTWFFQYAIGSMYGIYTNIGGILIVIAFMDPLG